MDKKQRFLVSEAVGTMIVSKLQRFLPDSKENSLVGQILERVKLKRNEQENRLWRLLPLERLSRPP